MIAPRTVVTLLRDGLTASPWLLRWEAVAAVMGAGLLVASPGLWLGLPSWVTVAVGCYFAAACLKTIEVQRFGVLGLELYSSTLTKRYREDPTTVVEPPSG